VGLKVEERFTVRAPAERVWSYLTDPQQVVGCLPGAELVEVQDEDTFVGRVRVKVGPVTASYKGKATFVERDPASRRVRMTGEGQETGGSGSAKMTMVSTLVELPDGGTEVRVEAEIEVVGKIVQFGRGMIDEVNRQLFRQFASCTQERLAEAASDHAGGGVAAEPVEEPVEELPAAAQIPPEVVLANAGSGQAPQQAPTQGSRPAPAPAASQPVRVIPLLLRSVWAMVRRLFGRG
jgi:uncharacterized protein